MSADYNFDYEFLICNCGFPTGSEDCTAECIPFPETYALCTLPDPSGTRYQKIYDKIEELLNLVAQLQHLRNFSSFITIDGTRYKVTIGNESFTAF